MKAIYSGSLVISSIDEFCSWHSKNVKAPQTRHNEQAIEQPEVTHDECY